MYYDWLSGEQRQYPQRMKHDWNNKCQWHRPDSSLHLCRIVCQRVAVSRRFRLCAAAQRVVSMARAWCIILVIQRNSSAKSLLTWLIRVEARWTEVTRYPIMGLSGGVNRTQDCLFNACAFHRDISLRAGQASFSLCGQRSVHGQRTSTVWQ